jgi:hypothetical protein
MPVIRQRKINDELRWMPLEFVDVTIDEDVVLVFKRGAIVRNVALSWQQVAQIIRAIKAEPEWLRHKADRWEKCLRGEVK